ncbi:MAG: hypothetical protein EBZ77_00160 [Chitinophagia bacterium]|nr:hypothetical protein [Chitinophagia bacterium]
MKRISIKAIAVICAVSASFTTFAGNKDRTGQSGAAEMLINPWARSTGVFGLNAAYIGGIEAMKSNIAGLAVDSALEIGVSRGEYLANTGISINNIAIAQPMKGSSVIALNIMSMSFGDIVSTDYFFPEGYGTYHPQFLNVQLGFAKQFSKSINVGVGATYISEQISNVNALGLAFEGGIQYVTGKRDNLHIGISLRNLGTNMRFTGTGFAVNAEQSQATPSFAVTAYQPSDKFGLPTYLNLGLAYDFYLDEHHLKSANSMPEHRLTVMGNFTSNSFLNDYLGAGAEYSYKNMFMGRMGYRYEKGIGNSSTANTMYTGLSMGVTVQSRIGAKGPFLAVDYSYRPTQRPANGVHMFSLRFTRAGVANGSDDDE